MGDGRERRECSLHNLWTLSLVCYFPLSLSLLQEFLPQDSTDTACAHQPPHIIHSKHLLLLFFGSPSTLGHPPLLISSCLPFPLNF